MDAIGYSSPWVPREWITAHGFLPRRWTPRSAASRHGTQTHHAMGTCPFADALAATFAPGSVPPFRALIAADRCDQMRRLTDSIQSNAQFPIFRLHVPAAVEPPASRLFFRGELERLGRFLVGLGGQTPTPDLFRECGRREGRARLHLRQLQIRVSARVFLEALLKFEHDGIVPSPLPDQAPASSGIPLALTGAPQLPEHLPFLDRLEQLGARIVFNASEATQLLLRPAELPPGYHDPLEALASQMLTAIPDVAQRSNANWVTWLHAQLDQSQARGMILWHYPWCDLWQAEIQRLQEELSIPVLGLNAGDGGGLTSSIDTRLQAFIEMLA
jgi:benzoyl-CoA reductase/2-hydroxyglutaryl-CoA dehydratase subunit BcrC/BadD/HgdB